MKTNWMLGMVLCGTVLVWGCGKEEPKVPAKPKAPEPAGRDDYHSATGLGKKADGLLEDKGTMLDEGKAEIGNEADKAAAAAKDAAKAGSAAANKAATDVMGAATQPAPEKEGPADPAVAQAKTLLDQVLQYIKDNKVELAETGLKQLDGMKASLPDWMQKQIESAHTALAAKKAGSAAVGAIEGVNK